MTFIWCKYMTVKKLPPTLSCVLHRLSISLCRLARGESFHWFSLFFSSSTVLIAEKILSSHTGHGHGQFGCVCAYVFVPVQFADGSQPADVAPAAGQDGQVVGVQREEEALGRELGLRELGRIFICFTGNKFYPLLTYLLQTSHTKWRHGKDVQGITNREHHCLEIAALNWIVKEIRQQMTRLNTLTKQKRM